MHNNKLKGIFVPAATAFDANGDVDPVRLAENYRAWQRTAIRGLMILGTNGECKQLTDRESLLVVETAAQARQPDKTLIVGAGRESLHATLAFIDLLAPHAERIDYLSVMTPHFFAKLMTDDALYGYYCAVADRSPVPVLLYMAPAYANGVTISADLACRLADHPNIAGIKDTSTDSMEALMTRLSGREDFTVLAGSVSNLMTCLRMGGSGGVVSAANYFPDECAHIANLYLSGDAEASTQAYGELMPLIRNTGGSKGIASLKACMHLLGYEAGAPRLPVLPLSQAELDNMRNHLREAGKI